MHLKRIELHGFKSFADKVNIEFKPGITGVVGPNGCGKSNITDAIRWVLGEQSVKSLRGSSMSQLIFNGSEDRKAQSVAEVTLVFDNSDKYIDCEYNEIEITRRLYRQDSEAEYLLNKQQCRLKDITNLIMDTGLGRDSLSMISQGNISSFADCRPEERRAIFEEAAGVAKYKKRKIESIRKLERTKENLERIGDIVNELEKQIAPLRRQKEKTETYNELNEQLTAIEVNVLVKEVTEAKNYLDKTSKELKGLIESQASKEADILLNDNKNKEIKDKMFSLDNEINTLQTKLLEAMNDVSKLETAKVEVDQKRKYIMDNDNQADIQEKIQNAKSLLSDLVEEYNNRIERLNATKVELDDSSKVQNEYNNQLVQTKQTIDSLAIQINNTKSRKEYLRDVIENKSGYFNGVKVVLKSFANNPNVYGTIGDLIDVNEEYEVAIATALGSALQFIVTSDNGQARECIRFLHDNKAGRATFLPVDAMEERSVRNDHKMVCNTLSGYLGVALDFCEYPNNISNVVANQLGNIIVCDNLENANKVSRATFKRYKIVTLTGDIVNVGGSLTGGSQDKKATSLSQKRELERVTQQLEELEKEYNSKRNELNTLDNKFKEASQITLQKQMSYAKLEVVVQNKREELILSKSNYESLSNQSIELEDLKSSTTQNKLIGELNEAVSYRDKLTEEIKSKREIRMSLVNQNDKLDLSLRDLRKELKEVQENINSLSIEATKKETQLNNFLERLSEGYHMTYEFALEQHNEEINIVEARQEVALLRNKIKALGNINFDAIEEYESVSTRYESMNSQRLDLIQAQDTILDAIKEMDQIMVEKFSTTFDQINDNFNQVFRTLFGGGKAKIKYTDPENILETGIDIDVQPPGKSVQNISLFSGGEKALIALSCLFSILKVRPVPMCILDEVEAPLDIANVERFAKYLREFSKETQFIVVTHREGTMAECDVLYGATMQQKGVTKLVSVKLEEAKMMSDAS